MSQAPSVGIVMVNYNSAAFIGGFLDSLAHLDYLNQALSSLKGVRGFGGIPRDQELAIPERHLGLATAEDHPLDDSYLERLADRLEAHLDLPGLLAALPRLTLSEEPALVAEPASVRLGVARDRAFCFYYPENLELLALNGAELVFFSPLKDRELPAALDGVYLGGGYPELYAEQLSANEGLKQALKQGAAGGLPIYAECGGLMYLAREILDLEGRAHPMAGISTVMLPGLGPGLPGSHLGSVSRRETPGGTSSLLEIIIGVLLYRPSPPGGAAVSEGYSEKNVLASYVHLHFGSNPEVARHLVASCRAYKENLGVGPGVGSQG
jgi:cobyrinic acid a,c-diamide synthase